MGVVYGGGLLTLPATTSRTAETGMIAAHLNTQSFADSDSQALPIHHWRLYGPKQTRKQQWVLMYDPVFYSEVLLFFYCVGSLCKQTIKQSCRTYV